MTLDFLTPEEVKNLTDRTRSDAQMRCLDELGIPYFVSGKGKPKVLRSSILPKPVPQTPSVLP